MALIAAGLLCAHARAQGAAYCNIIRISAKRLPNAVQVTIQADGAMRLDANIGDFFNMKAMQDGKFEDVAKPVISLPFRVVNARSKVSSFTDIGIYPVSHVEASVPTDTPEGIGVNLRVALLAPAVPESVAMFQDYDFVDPSRKGSVANVQLTPDKTTLIVVVTSDRQTAQPIVLRTAPPGAPVQLDVSSQGENVSIHALNADLKDLLRRMAVAARREIVLNGTTDHTVSLWLDDVPLHTALSTLAIAYGLNVDDSGPVLQFSDADARSVPSFGMSVTEIIPLRSIKATVARECLPDFLLRYTSADLQQNTLTVSGPDYLARKVREDVAALDHPSPQVEVSAQVIEFASSDDLDTALGIATGRGHRQTTVDIGSGDISIHPLDVAPAGFEARLRGLQAKGRAHLIATPSGTALLGNTAELFVGQRKFVKTMGFDFSNGEWTARFLGVDVGARLSVKPLMLGDGGVTVHLEPSVSTISELEPITGLPTVNTRNLATTLRVKDGDTLVVGGLGMRQTGRARRGIPFLRNLPLIGGLFRLPGRSDSFSELIFLVTIHVRDAAERPRIPAAII